MLGRMMQVPMRKRGFDRRLARRRGGRRDRRWRGARGCAEGRSVGNVAVNVSPRLASPRGLAAVLQVFVLNPGLVFFKFFPILFSFPFLFRRFCEERREDHWWWEPVKSNYDESGRTSGVGILVNFFFFLLSSSLPHSQYGRSLSAAHPAMSHGQKLFSKTERNSSSTEKKSFRGCSHN